MLALTLTASAALDRERLTALHTVWRCCSLLDSNAGAPPVAATSSHRDVAFWQDSACALSVRNGACTSMELMEAEHTFECCADGATRVECDDVRDMCLEEWWSSAPSEDQIVSCNPRTLDDDMIEGCEWDKCKVELGWLHYAKARSDLQSRCGVRRDATRRGLCRCQQCAFCEGVDYDYSHSARPPESCSFVGANGGVFLAGMLGQTPDGTDGGAGSAVPQLTLVVVLDKVPHYAAQPYIRLVWPREVKITTVRRATLLSPAMGTPSHVASIQLPLGLGLDDQSHEVLLQIEASYVTRATMPRIECTMTPAPPPPPALVGTAALAALSAARAGCSEEMLLADAYGVVGALRLVPFEGADHLTHLGGGDDDDGGGGGGGMGGGGGGVGGGAGGSGGGVACDEVQVRLQLPGGSCNTIGRLSSGLLSALRELRIEVAGGTSAAEEAARAVGGVRAWEVAAPRKPDLAPWDPAFGATLQGEALLRQLLTPEGVRISRLTAHQSARLRVVLPATVVAPQRVGPEAEMVPGTSVDLTQLHSHVPSVLVEGASSIELFLLDRFSRLGCDDNFHGVCRTRPPADLVCQPSAGPLGYWGATYVLPSCAASPQACEDGGEALTIGGLERGPLMGELQLPELHCAPPGCAFKVTLKACRALSSSGRCEWVQTYASGWSERSVSTPLEPPASGATRLELRFDGSVSGVPVVLEPWEALGAELAALLHVEEERVHVRETHALRDSSLSFAVFDLLPGGGATSSWPTPAALAQRLASQLEDLSCESLLDPGRELWTTDACLSGRESAKLAVDGSLDHGYPAAWRACPDATDGGYTHEQMLRVALRRPVQPGETLLLRLLGPSSGTAAFGSKVVAMLGAPTSGNAKAAGMRGPAAVCTAEPSTPLRDGGVSVARCVAPAAVGQPSSLLYLSGHGSGAVGEAGAGGLAIAEVQACTAGSASPLFALSADGADFAHPRLARVDLRAGLLRLESDGRTTQLTPTLISRQYNGEPKHHWTGRLVVGALVLLLGLTVAGATKLRRLRREWFGQDAVEREGLNRDEEDGAGEEEDDGDDEEAYDVDEVDQRQRGGVPSRASL